MNQMFTLPERSQGVKVERDAANFFHRKWKSRDSMTHKFLPGITLSLNLPTSNF